MNLILNVAVALLIIVTLLLCRHYYYKVQQLRNGELEQKRKDAENYRMFKDFINDATSTEDLEACWVVYKSFADRRNPRFNEEHLYVLRSLIITRAYKMNIDLFAMQQS